jgi:hypothetical protein
MIRPEYTRIAQSTNKEILLDAARVDWTTILQTLQGNHSPASEMIQSEQE